jgi:glycosyltransferase involved in cell wall biosynthesis
MTGRRKKLYQFITPRLRRRDAKPRSYDIIYANSESTKKQIKKIYFPLLSPQIEVIHPPIEPSFFHETIVTKPDNYFFYINRLTKLFKHLDRIILLCNKYKVPLLIAGDGPDKAYLQSIA